MTQEANPRGDREFECLYRCGSGNPSTQIYHVYPFSASEFELTLPTGVVCDGCNKYFSKLEAYFVQHHPGTVDRLICVSKTRKGKPPKLALVPGEATREVKDGCHELSIPLTNVTHSVLPNGDLVLNCKADRYGFDALKISRVLAKMTFESLCAFYPDATLAPENARMAPLRDYARLGNAPFVWFAWKKANDLHAHPKHILIQDPDCPPLGLLCRLSLPGVAYLFPLPPYPLPELIPQMLEGWTVVDRAGIHDLEPFTVDVFLKRFDPADGLESEQ